MPSAVIDLTDLTPSPPQTRPLLRSRTTASPSRPPAGPSPSARRVLHIPRRSMSVDDDFLDGPVEVDENDLDYQSQGFSFSGHSRYSGFEEDEVIHIENGGRERGGRGLGQVEAISTRAEASTTGTARTGGTNPTGTSRMSEASVTGSRAATTTQADLGRQSFAPPTEVIDMSLSDDDNDDDNVQFLTSRATSRPTPQHRTRAVDNQDDFIQTMNNIDQTIRLRSAQLRQLRQSREDAAHRAERIEREHDHDRVSVDIFSPPPVIPTTRRQIGLGGAMLRAGGRDVVFHGNGSVTRGFAPRSRLPDLDDEGDSEGGDFDDPEEQGNRVQHWLGNLDRADDENEDPSPLRRLLRGIGRTFGGVGVQSSVIPGDRRRDPIGTQRQEATGQEHRASPFRPPPMVNRTRSSPALRFTNMTQSQPNNAAPETRPARYDPIGRRDRPHRLNGEEYLSDFRMDMIPDFAGVYGDYFRAALGGFGLDAVNFSGMGGGAGRRGEDDVQNIISSVKLPPMPKTHEGFARTFDMEELEKIIPIELESSDEDSSDDDSNDSKIQTEKVKKTKVKKAKNSIPCLVCAKCHEPLLISSAYKSDDDRVYSLQCGHMIDGRCLTSLSNPTPSQIRLKAQPPTQHDLALTLGPKGEVVSSVKVEGRDEEHDHREGEEEEEDSDDKSRVVTKRQKTKNGAVNVRYQPPRGAGSGRTGLKAKKSAVQREYEWNCPIEWCKEPHLSIESGDRWVMKDGDGAIQIYA